MYELFTAASPRGSKIILYGASGMGKTTLAAMAPKPVFVAVDDGIDEVMHPVTGKPLARFKAASWRDLRNILADPDRFKGFETVVLDSSTESENFCGPFVLETIPNDKGGYMKNLEQYGYSKGYKHVSDHMNYLRYDLQRLCEAGYNVIVIAQQAPIKRSEAGVEDYFKDTPKMVYRPTVGATAALDYVEWSDHCFRIGYGEMKVKAKRVSGSGERVIYVHPEVHFEAKSRTIPGDFPIVSFEDKADDSIWQFVFEQAWKNMEVEDE